MKKYVVKVHSLIDIITNSSTELFIVDKNKVQESMKEFFQFILECNEIDYETSICKYDESSYKEDFILPDEYKDDTSSLYVIDASYHNQLLNKIISEFFNPIEIKYE